MITINLINTTMVMFYPGIIIKPLEEVFNDLKIEIENLKLLFLAPSDLTSFSIDLANVPPPPLLHLSDDKNTFEIQLSHKNSVLIFKKTFSIENDFNIISKVYRYLTENLFSKIVRIGIITNWQITLSEPYNYFIISKFLRENSIKDTISEIEIHWLTNPVIEGISCNYWIRIMPDRTPGITNNTAFCIMDLNTPHNKPIDFSIELIEKLLKEGFKLHKEKLEMYLGG